MIIARLLSYMPLWVLYLFTDILYLFGYHIFKYRQKIILDNLLHAFPEKSPEERKVISKKFFRNLTDTFAETLKFYTISKSELAKMLEIKEAKSLSERVDKGEIVIMVSGHFMNWEAFVLGFNALVDSRLETIYTRINNKKFDRLMMNIRGRFGGTLVEKSNFSRNFLEKRNVPRIIGLAADQRPGNAEIRYTARFMNRETAFFEGPEKLAKRYGYAVYYVNMTKPKRGQYRITYHLLCAPPYAETPAHSITDEFIRLTEQGIRTQPEIYLWSHNRWK
jgi:Kdo2-lipid IVA lauroyltransferase/acyltransferase